MMGKVTIEQYNSGSAPTASAKKTSPLLRAHAGHGMVLDVKFYLRDALMAWLKFKKGHLFISFPMQRETSKDFVKLPNKGETKNFMQLYGS